MMTPERWRQVERLVEAALEVEIDARANYLDQACDGDPGLRREVEALLASLDQVDSFMERPAAHGYQPVDLDSNRLATDPNAISADPGAAGRWPNEPVEGDHIDRYRIVHKIGQGGMGTVYAATRDDQEFEHRVAIKLIQPGMHTGTIAQRFRSERQILANLEHPNIARLLDGGTTEDGRPYFVMELIEGHRIDRYCDRHRLSTRQRLELFLDVCAAVDYAHRNLVVHRDIKPSNILVTDTGLPKLLDFGIAKLLDPSGVPHTVEATHTGLRPMTPPYASPEQILGRAITTASDVYSLGVLLYKLLTGRLPFSMQGLSPQEMQRAVLENQVIRPSLLFTQSGDVGEHSQETVSRQRGTQPQQLQRQLAGDLDNIILMALRHEPERRYGSAEQLSEDLRRHLEGLPVSARRDTFSYRAGKFLRRNKIAAGVASTSAALVLGFAAAMARQAVQLARQRDRAQKERDKADRERSKADLERDKAVKVSAFLTELFDVADPEKGGRSNLSAREVLERGVEKIRRELEDHPDVMASLMSAIGKIYRKMGFYDQATPLLVQALAMREKILGKNHFDVAETLNELGTLYYYQGLYPRARKLFQRALDIRSIALGMTDPRTVEITINLATSYLWGGDSESASSLIECSLQILEDTPGAPTTQLAQVLALRCVYCIEKGEYDRAEESQLRAIALLEGESEPNQLAIAKGVINLGNVYSSSSDCRRAESAYRRALKILRQVVGNNHTDTAICVTNIGICHSLRGEYHLAESAFHGALEILEETLGPNHRTCANILNRLAICCRRSGDLNRAESLFAQASEAYEHCFSEPNIDVAYNLYHFAHLYRDSERFDRAEELYHQAAAIQERALGSSHIDLAESLNGLAVLHRRRGNYVQAEAFYDQSLVVAGRAASRYPMNPRMKATLAAGHQGRGDLHRALGQNKKARQAWLRSLNFIETATPNTEMVDFLDIHCGTLLRLDRITEARPIVDRLLAINWCTQDFLDLCSKHRLRGAGS